MMTTYCNHRSGCQRRQSLLYFVTLLGMCGWSSPTVATATENPAGNRFYSDCSSFSFVEIDSTLLTREEQLALMEQDFKNNLARTEACMNQAASSSAQRLSSSGAGDSGQDALTSEDATEAEAPVEQPLDEVSPRDIQRADASRPHKAEKGVRGSSAVCDAVRQGLAGATTDAEKVHFEQLAKEYNC